MSERPAPAPAPSETAAPEPTPAPEPTIKPGPLPESPFPQLQQTTPDHVEKATYHTVLHDDENCTIYEAKFTQPGQVSSVHYHNDWTAYVAVGDPDVPGPAPCSEFFQATKDKISSSVVSVQMPPAFGCSCNCISLPMMLPPPLGASDIYFHRVGLAANCGPCSTPYWQIGVEVKRWPPEATPEALPAPSGVGLPAQYSMFHHMNIAKRAMEPSKTKVFNAWRLELKPGESLEPHTWPFPCALVCAWGPTMLDGEAGSPLVGLKSGDVKWLPLGCADTGKVTAHTDASGPFIAMLVQFTKESLAPTTVEQPDELPSVVEWGEKVFQQFDTDKDGKLSKKELVRALRSLPKKKPKAVPPGTKFMSLNELMSSMDSDGDGGIDLQEWLDNLKSCAGLAAAIAENINEVGEIPTFRTYEQQQAKRKAEVAELEAQETRTEEEELLLEDFKRQILNLQAKIEEAAANQLKLNEWGRTTFEQFDTDKNGKLSPKELATALKALPRRKPKNIPPGSRFMSIDEMMDAMDGDGDGSIDVDEWLTRLGTCAGLAAALSENVNEDGKLSNFVPAEPEPEPVVEPEATPTEKSAADPVVEPEAEADSVEELQSGAEPAVKSDVEPGTEPATEPEAEPAMESAAEPGVEPAAEPEAEVEPEPELEP